MPVFDPTRFTPQAQIDTLTALPPFRDMYGVLPADFTLLSQTTVQRLFNWTTLGALTLPTGTHVFTAMLNIDTMSATSGNGVFDLLGTGTATLASITQQALGVDATTLATQAAASAALANIKTVQMALAAVGTGVGAIIRGTFNVTVAGTIIPSILLDTAAAAIVRQGSYIQITRLGESGQVFGGPWA